MTLGNNIGLKDKLIRKTTGKENITSNKNKANNASKIIPSDMLRKHTATSLTKKATFYVKKDLLEKLYNFAYWERHNITDAFNIALADGLKEKTTKNKEQS